MKLAAVAVTVTDYRCKVDIVNTLKNVHIYVVVLLLELFNEHFDLLALRAVIGLLIRPGNLAGTADKFKLVVSRP